MDRSELSRALGNAHKNLLRKYTCVADNYSVVYDPVKRSAVYTFKGENVTVASISNEQVDYLIKIGYWNVL